MRSYWAARSSAPPRAVHPALHSFADECRDAATHMLAYIGALTLIAIVVVAVANPFADAAVGAAMEPAAIARASWSLAPRSHPAFAVSQIDLTGHAETYDIVRSSAGGRKDVLRWTAPGERRPAAELEIYRQGAEAAAAPPAAEIAARMDPDSTREIEAAGVIDSKFGPVMLLRLPDPAGNGSSCLGFLKSIEHPGLRISGWSCQGATAPAKRAAIGCMLNRLVLLNAGNDPKLADLFARAELRRTGCGSAAAQTGALADWVNSAHNPRLRGGL